MSQEKNEDKSQKNASETEYYFGGITEYKLEDIEAEVLNDNVYLDVFAGSDKRFKTNVSSYAGALDQLTKLDVLKYHYKSSEFPQKEFPNGEQVGLMAQDLEKVFPHLVKEDEEGYKHVNYAGLTPMLVQGIQELLSVSEKQAAVIQNLSEAVKRLEAKVDNEQERPRS